MTEDRELREAEDRGEYDFWSSGRPDMGDVWMMLARSWHRNNAKAIEARSAKTTKIGLARRAKARSRSDLPNPEGSIHEGQ